MLDINNGLKIMELSLIRELDILHILDKLDKELLELVLVNRYKKEKPLFQFPIIYS